MIDWTAGYVADIDYTYGYYSALNPLRAKFAFLNQGLVFPEVGAACELGFGQGLSTNIHAAASVTQWHGTDFNPSQAGFAQELAAASGASAKLYDEAFSDFALRDDLPDFDFIGLHGIWSWISNENRAVIVDFIRRKLKVGGVLYISYNTLPGWAAFAPVRHLMTEHAQILGSEGGGIVSRIDGAIDFTEKLLATNPAFSRATPQVAERLKSMKEHNRHYLAHEYFNRDWHPMHFGTMADMLEGAKLQYACSAHYLNHIDNVNLTAEQQAFLQEIPDRNFSQSVRDFMVNEQFRRDYWVKGARTLSSLEQLEALREQQVLLITPRENVSLQTNGALGEVTMSEAIYNPILDLLADHKIRSLGQIEQQLKISSISVQNIIQSCMVLIGAGNLALAQNGKLTETVKQQSQQLNAYLCKKARSSNDNSYLASPVTGEGFAVSRIRQLFIAAINDGKKQPKEWAEYALQVLNLQNQKLIKNGKTLELDEENLAELNLEAKEFKTKWVPILQALQII